MFFCIINYINQDVNQLNSNTFLKPLTKDAASTKMNRPIDGRKRFRLASCKEVLKNYQKLNIHLIQGIPVLFLEAPDNISNIHNFLVRGNFLLIYFFVQ